MGLLQLRVGILFTQYVRVELIKLWLEQNNGNV
jgi:hypothetical protein